MKQFPYKVPGPEDKFYPGRITPETLRTAGDSAKELLQSIAEGDAASERLRGMVASLNAAIQRLKTVERRDVTKTVPEAEFVFIQTELEIVRRLLQEQEAYREKTNRAVEEFRMRAKKDNLKFMEFFEGQNLQN